MMFFNFNVYVGCSLTHAPEPFKKEVLLLRDALCLICHVLCFQGLTDDPAYQTYMHDIHGCVYKADLVVAITDYPSIGLGYEIATQAEARKKSVLAVAHESSKVTKLILDPRLPGYEFRRYKHLCKDVVPMVKDILVHMNKLRNSQLSLFTEELRIAAA